MLSGVWEDDVDTYNVSDFTTTWWRHIIKVPRDYAFPHEKC